MHLACSQHKVTGKETTAGCVRFLTQAREYMLSPTTPKHTWSVWALALRSAEAHCATVQALDVRSTDIVAVMQQFAPTQEEVHRPRNDYTATTTEVAAQPQGAPKGTAEPPKDEKNKIPKS